MLRRLPWSSSAAAAVVVAVMVVVGWCAALLTDVATAAHAAPYPPTPPCVVTAVARATVDSSATSVDSSGSAVPGGASAAPADKVTYDVTGSGLEPEQPVRVVAADTGQPLATTRSDDGGGFRTSVTTERRPVTPNFRASTPRRTCTSAPGTSAPGTSAPGGPTSATRGGSPGGAGPVAGDTGGAGGPAPTAGGSAGDSSSAPTTAPTSSPTSPTSSATSGPTKGAGTRSPGAPRAEPGPSRPLPFGIGLGIAAILLVLGTLAVLLLTRRPER